MCRRSARDARLNPPASELFQRHRVIRSSPGRRPQAAHKVFNPDAAALRRDGCGWCVSTTDADLAPVCGSELRCRPDWPVDLRPTLSGEPESSTPKSCGVVEDARIVLPRAVRRDVYRELAVRTLVALPTTEEVRTFERDGSMMSPEDRMPRSSRVCLGP
jgi:hypothetical protein